MSADAARRSACATKRLFRDGVIEMTADCIFDLFLKFSQVPALSRDPASFRSIPCRDQNTPDSSSRPI